MLDNPPVLRRLQQEFRDFHVSSSAPARWKDLEQLPYLTSVLLEGLRLSYGLASRLPRVAPDRIIRYRDFDIPAGVRICMSFVTPPNSSDFISQPCDEFHNCSALIHHGMLTDTGLHVLASDSPQRGHLPRPVEVRPAALDGRKEAAVSGAISGQLLERDEELYWDKVSEIFSIFLT